MSSSSLEDLAASITEQVSKLSSLHKELGLPAPTLEKSGSRDYATEADTPEGEALRETRSRILNAAADLVRLVQGPTDHILNLTWSAADSANIDTITRLKLPAHVPLDSSITLEELSAAVRVPLGYLTRIVRFGIANGLFVEPQPGVVAHSAASAALAENQHLSNIVHFGTEFLGNILVKTPDYILAHREDPGKAPKAPFNVAYRTEQNLFEFFQGNADLTTKYHEYLAGRVNTPLWSVDRLRAAYPWSSFGAATIVDVGGSSGHTVQSLAPLIPDATFIVQDNNVAALDMGRRDVEPDVDLKARIRFEEHDFFTPQPVAADAYIFRHILHDWSDADSIKILSSLLPALRPGAKVLISEGLLPQPPAVRLNTLASKMIRIEDAFMLAAHDAKERSVDDFVGLFEQAKAGGFKLAGVTSGSQAGAFQSLLAFEYVG